MRIVWLLFAALGVALSVQAFALWGPGTRPSNGAAVSYIGLQLSVLGTYISVVGFTLAIHQILRSQSATGAAEAALAEVKKKLSGLSASGEVERARFALEETERHISSRQYKNVRFSISPARQSLVRVSELEVEVFAELMPQIEATVRELGELADKIDSGEKDYELRAGRLIRSYLDLTNRMQVRLARA